jgi:hypothetical protein
MAAGRAAATTSHAQLLAPVLERADADGQLCYLETPFPQTHAFYHRLGFEHGDQLHVFDQAPAVVAVLRQPRSRTQKVPLSF